MKHIDDENGFGERESPIVFRMGVREFQREVIVKLGRLEAMMEMLVGGSQPGRMKIAEDRIRALEDHDIRRGVYDRVVSAVIAAVVSAGIAMHDHFFK